MIGYLAGLFAIDVGAVRSSMDKDLFSDGLPHTYRARISAWGYQYLTYP